MSKKAVVLQWDKKARCYRYVQGHDRPLDYAQAELVTTMLHVDDGGHYIPVPLDRLDGKRILEPKR